MGEGQRCRIEQQRRQITMGETEEKTIFGKILDKEIPSKAIYEDDKVYAFHDVNPQAPFHVLVIPKRRDIKQLRDIVEGDEADIAYLMRIASQLGKENCPDGFRTIINDGPQGGQTVYHLHVHVVGGRQMKGF